jgi:hypothetical protein
MEATALWRSEMLLKDGPIFGARYVGKRNLKRKLPRKNHRVQRNTNSSGFARIDAGQSVGNLSGHVMDKVVHCGQKEHAHLLIPLILALWRKVAIRHVMCIVVTAVDNPCGLAFVEGNYVT